MSRGCILFNTQPIDCEKTGLQRLAPVANLRFDGVGEFWGMGVLELVAACRAQVVAKAATVARPKRRGALLASTAFTGAFAAVIAGHPTSALAACSGVNTANVLCDAANQATAGTLNTTFAGTTVVNVNPGGKIDTGGALATVTAAGSLTFNNNDTTFGITNPGVFASAVTLINNFGAITYLGNANAVGSAGSGVSAAKGGGTGDITITSNATATGGGFVGINVSHFSTGNILVTGSGDANGSAGGIRAFHQGASGGITISGSGGSGGISGAVLSTAIGATISSASNGSDILINRSGPVVGTGGIGALTAGKGKITVTGFGTVTSTTSPGIFALASGGNVSVTGGGNISTANDSGISATIIHTGHIDIAPAGTVSGRRGIVADTTASTGTATVTVSNNVTSLAGAGVRTLTGSGLATVNVTGGTINAGGLSGNGILHQGNGGFLLNMTGGQVGTAASRAAAGGISATVSGPVGGIDITSTNVFSTGTGINATLDGPTSRNIAITTNGVTDSSTGTGIFAGIAGMGSSGNIAIAQNGAVTGGYGIVVLNSGSGAATVTVNAPVTGTQVRGVLMSGGIGNTLINNSTINGPIGVETNGNTTVINRGSIGTIAPSTFAVTMSNNNNVFVMEGPGAVLNGDIIAFGSNNTFRLAGSGSNSFNVSQIYALTPTFAVLDKTGASNWTLTGTATYAGPVTVREGTLTVNGSLASASGISVALGATVGGSGTLPATTISAGASLSPGNSIGTVTISGNLTFVGAGNYVVEVAPTAADRTNVTGAPGTATLSGTLRAVGTGGIFSIGQRYTVLNAAGGISGTFGTLAVSGNFGVTKPHVEYDASNVYLVLDANQISPSLTNATANQRAVATAADAAVLAGNTSALFGALFNVPAAQLPGALDQLSGEVHASTAGVLADESLYVRSGVLGRLRQASYGDMAAMAALSLGGPQVAFADGEPDQLLSYDAKSPRLPVKAAPKRATADVVFWAQGFGAWGRFDGDGNAAPVRRDLAGVITGVDTRVGSNGRLGIAAGYTGSKNALDGRGSVERRDRAHCGLRRLALRRVQPARRRRLCVPQHRHRPHDRIPGLLRPRFRQL